MKTNKKSEGLSLTVVIIAIIVLIVMVVLILIFTGKIGLFNRGVSECPPNSTLSDSCAEGQIPLKYLPNVSGEGPKYCCPKVAP